MKNYKEMANNVFERRDQYEIEKMQKRKMLMRTLTPICCACFMMLLGLGLWQGGMFHTTPPQTTGDLTIQGEKDWYGLGESELSVNTQDDSDKKAMKLVYEGKRYIEVTNMSYENVELDKKIGNGEDFEGTYTEQYLSKIYGNYVVDGDKIRITITSEVFTVKDHPDVLCVKLSNGDMNLLKTYD